MSRVQLALNVNDLDESIAFYAKLFNTEPAKIRPGYANFAVTEPPLKLILIENPGSGGSINHLGVEVTDTDTVDAEQTRLAEAGFASTDERDTTCCYAKQDKFWVEGAPNGERWEIYTVLADSPTFAATAAGSGCCGTDVSDRDQPAATTHRHLLLRKATAMTNPIISQLIAGDRQRQLTADAARQRLAAIASCCRPSRIAAAARALRARLTTASRPTACCP